jgi:hypothetical protein
MSKTNGVKCEHLPRDSIALHQVRKCGFEIFSTSFVLRAKRPAQFTIPLQGAAGTGVRV